MDSFNNSVCDSDSPIDAILLGIGVATKRNIEDFLIQKCGFPARQAATLRVDLFKTYGSTLDGLRKLGYEITAEDYHGFVHGRLSYESIKPDTHLQNVLCSIDQQKIILTNSDHCQEENFDVFYCEAECMSIDPQNKKVLYRATQGSNGKEQSDVDYDYPVIAISARSNTFNTPSIKENYLFLKEVENAQRIRKTNIDCSERASLPTLTDEERKKVLQFLVVGGCPTGVEFASELHDFFNEDVVKLYPKVKDLVKITLLDAGDHILNMFDKRITSFAEEKFQRDGIDLKTGSTIVKVSDKEISTKERSRENSSISYAMVVWSTGIGPHCWVLDGVRSGYNNKNNHPNSTIDHGWKSIN